MKVARTWLEEYLGEKINDTKAVADLLLLHAFEVESITPAGHDEVLTIDILPNRASDCLSHRGIAREIATLTDRPLAYDPLRDETTLLQSEALVLHIDEATKCQRFGGAVVTDIAIKESPKWLQERLTAIGQQSINNVVDATNYIMFSLGQPLHAYDAGKLSQRDGAWHLGVRFAKSGEKVTVLSGETYELDTEIPLIVDQTCDRALGIAGIKGGSSAAVDEHTTSIILEAAHFDPAFTRTASQKLKLQTDASKRFENNPSPQLIPHALREVVKLILEIAGGICEGYADLYPRPQQNEPVSITLERINSLLGVRLSKEEVGTLCTRLGFYTEYREEVFHITAPFERTDINIEEDVVEEVGRVYGYQHVTGVLPEPAPLTEYNARHFYSEKIRTALVERGYAEVITSSFRREDVIELRNYLAADKACLRSSLRKNIEEALERNVLNIELLNVPVVRIFEIGTVFEKSENGDDVREHMSLSMGVRTKKGGPVPEDDALLQATIQELSSALAFELPGEIQAGVFECNLTDVLVTAPEPSAYEPVTPTEDVTYTPYSPYPYITRDLALWVPAGISPKEIEKTIVDEAGELLLQVSLFDEFRREERVSYAFRLIFQSMDRTLTDEEVNTAIKAVSRALQKKGYEMR